MTNHDETTQGASLAIIGMTGRFPDALTPLALWQNVVNGRRAIRPLSDEECRAACVPPDLLNHTDYVKSGVVLPDIDKFDAPFFGFSPREAETMDPQSRLFLQCAWEALEDAGYDPESYDGLIGVVAGKAPSEYLRRNLVSNPEVRARLTRLQVASGNDADALASMVAYKLNLRGPSLSVQTFCSTSLVAVHLACQSLLAYEADLVLAGGVAIEVPQGAGYLYQEGGILSPDGVCRSFDARANGSVMGSGLGIVVLKRLAEAVADGDHIYAVIRGSALNNDGLTRVSYAAPGLNGQAEVIAEALANANVPAESIGYIETHGTATPLGDSVELGAMERAFRQSTTQVGFCAIGSVKPNIGHLDRASGVTGLIKASLALQQRQIPPSLNFESPHPDFDWVNSPFYVNTRLQAWARPSQWPRRAGVSSFGLGGTNVHLVLEEAPAAEVLPPAPPAEQLLLLSAKSEAALQRMSQNLADYLAGQPALNLADVAYTLQVGRAQFNYRQMVVCRDTAEAVAQLNGQQPERVYRRQQSHRQRPVAFLFPGVGDHYRGMGQSLYQDEPVFREWVDRCCQLLQPELGGDLRQQMWGEANEKGHSRSLGAMLNGERAADGLSHTRWAQPAVFVIEYALAQLLRSWGIEPTAMVGHSLGEYVAACVAGVMSLEEALRLVARRAALIAQTEAGALLTVALPAAEVAVRMPDELALSGVLTPAVCVVGGREMAVRAWAAQLQGEGISCRLLPTDHAYHTPLLASIQEEFRQLLAEVEWQPPQLPYLSNVTGDWITAAQATDPAYWAEHLCQPVQMAQALGTLLAQPETVLLEVGAGQALAALVKQHPGCERERMNLILPLLPGVYEAQPERAFVLAALGKLWLAGVEIAWTAVWQHQSSRRLSLPTYPFEPLRFWVEENAVSLPAAKPAGKKQDIGDWFYLPTWKQTKVWSQVEQEQAMAVPAVWLIFTDQQGLGCRIADRLEQDGDTVFRVQTGTAFAAHGDNQYCLNPADPQEYRKLLKALPAFPTHIVHLWGMDAGETAVSPASRFAQAQQCGFYSLLFLEQAMDRYADALTIWAISNGAQPVTGCEKLFPERATILGACRVIAQENANIRCGYLDIEWPPSLDWQVEWLAGQVLAEIKEPPDQLAVAYRGQRRWVQTFAPVLLPEGQRMAVWRPQGVYLITGGLGGIGLTLARHLAQTAQARLVLTTRAAFPLPDTWSAWLANHNENEPTSLKIRRLQEIESLGGVVRVIQADVADETQMRAMLAEAEVAFGPLHGVFHTAGVSGRTFFAPVQELNVAQCEAHFRPKAYGLLVLEKVLADRQLDFCLLFSSLSSILGGLGFAAYTAANAFIDSFTHQHNQQHAQWWSSVNWDTWQLVANAHAGLGATVAQFEMQPAEALQALTRVIANGPVTQLVNSTGDLDARLDQWVRMLSIHAGNPAGSQGATHPRPEMMTAYAPPTNETERIIAEIWEQVLGIAPIGINDNFLELGGHSLIAMEVLSQLRHRFQVHLPLTLLFEAPTVQQTVLAVELAIIEELEAELTEEEIEPYDIALLAS